MNPAVHQCRRDYHLASQDLWNKTHILYKLLFISVHIITFFFFHLKQNVLKSHDDGYAVVQDERNPNIQSKTMEMHILVNIGRKKKQLEHKKVEKKHILTQTLCFLSSHEAKSPNIKVVDMKGGGEVVIRTDGYGGFLRCWMDSRNKTAAEGNEHIWWSESNFTHIHSVTWGVMQQFPTWGLGSLWRVACYPNAKFPTSDLCKFDLKKRGKETKTSKICWW